MAAPRIFRHCLFAIFAFGLALMSGTASALIIQVSNPNSMTQGPYLVEDFEDSTLVSGLTTNGTFPFAAASIINSGQTTSGTHGAVDLFFDPPVALTFTFATAVSSVGMFFGNDDPSEPIRAVLDIFGTAGLLGSISVVANENDSIDQFIGFISDQQVTSVSLQYIRTPFGNPSSLAMFVDDLQFNQAVTVPEPATLALLGLGLGWFGLGRRRTS